MNETEEEAERPSVPTSLIYVKALLNLYIQLNYTGGCRDTSVIEEITAAAAAATASEDGDTDAEDHDSQNLLILDGEAVIENVQHPFLILLAEKLLEKSKSSARFPSAHWWKIRALFLHQKFLEEKSSVLWKAIQEEMVELERVEPDYEAFWNINPKLKVFYYCELSEIYGFYYDTENGKKFINLAKEAGNIRVEATGVLGKRTKHQQSELAQLVLTVDRTVDGQSIQLVPATEPLTIKIPQSVVLDDEDRLDKLNLNDKEYRGIKGNCLADIEHLIVLADFHLKRKYLPNDGIYLEELLAYLSYLTEFPRVWCLQIVALLQRSVLECNSRRTVERSMKQFEVLKKAIDDTLPTTSDRLNCFYGSGLGMKWEIDVNLAQVLCSLHLYKEALDISLALNRWEDVITCYTALQLRHKAEEIIREQLEKEETVKLWILLGDATDNVEYYEKAWNFSKHRSAKAQRQWGYYYFTRKQYAEAIPHLEKSLELNPLENPAWIRLGYAALDTQNWKLSTRAYQHSSTLDGDNYEIWNNLANGFIKMGEKIKGLRALKEASKCNYENWKVWDNSLVTATDCKAFDEVLRSYNRLIDLKGKWCDEEVLTMLTRAITMNLLDANDSPCQEKYLKGTLKLFGRITSVITNNPKVWKLYSDLVLLDYDTVDANSGLNWIKSVNYSQKSVQSILSEPNWSKTDKDLSEAVEFTVEYIKRIHDFKTALKDNPNFTVPDDELSKSLTAAQFTVKRIYSTIKKVRDTAINQTQYDEYLKNILNNLEKLNLEI